MADPISIMAIAGLVYAGRKLSKPTETYISEGAPIEQDSVQAVSYTHLTLPTNREV